MQVGRRTMLAGAVSLIASLSVAGTLDVSMLPGEHWWGGANDFGLKMPFTDSSSVDIDLRRTNYSNQFASFLVSDKGRYIWCDEQSLISVSNGIIRMTSDPTNERYSDTAIFITDYLAEMVRKSSDLRNQTLLDRIYYMARSKFAIMDNSGYIATVGHFIDDHGLLFSNDSYQTGWWY